MLTYFLFVFYFVCGTLLLHYALRKKHFPFTLYHTTAIVAFKLFLGGLYGYIFLNRYGGDDTWHAFYESRELTEALIRHPAHFFAEILPSNSLDATGHSPWKATVYYLAHFEAWYLPRILAVINFFTGKNYYLDLIWFDFLALAGPLLLFKTVYRRYPEKRGMYFLLIFFVPTISFWISGIRAEAFLLCFLCFIVYQMVDSAGRPTVRHWLKISAGLIGILLFRPQLLPVLLVAGVGFLYALRKPDKPARPFLIAWIAVVVLFFAGFLLPLPFRPATFVIKSQQGFFSLKGNTRYPLDSLTQNPVSFLKVLPQALANSSLRPYPWEGKGLLQSFSASESVLLFIALLYYFLSSTGRRRDPLLWFFFFYGITQLLAIGFVVPFPGAIVRYRSIPLLFLLLFLFYRNDPVHEKLNLLLPA